MNARSPTLNQDCWLKGELSGWTVHRVRATNQSRALDGMFYREPSAGGRTQIPRWKGVHADAHRIHNARRCKCAPRISIPIAPCTDLQRDPLTSSPDLLPVDIILHPNHPSINTLYVRINVDNNVWKAFLSLFHTFVHLSITLHELLPGT
jgi:hypothetical protein